MTTNKTSLFIKVFVSITFLAMILVNALANSIPINGIGTGQVSDYYKNLFAPAGITFAIWGLIYLLLAGYTLYQLGVFQGSNKSDLLNRVGVCFSISSIANAVWIFSWHYQVIAVSMVLMIIILGCLIFINKEINKAELISREKFFVRLPFSVYFGWITVATIANVTTLLVSIGWDGFGLPEQTWTVMILLVGAAIGIATTLRNKDMAYGLVIIWAYAGILLKHLSESGFSKQYPTVIMTSIICLVLFFMVEVYVLIFNKKELI
ncbi:MAG: lantibiotic ABC transporter permease [Firmicutes bacterium HGW-Firmicutes-1]|jgi:hypothetical protein|nr:MAG: lantibiotic ABC transporter permease [Firmicutes bacterium HGW-Firmicutes-1]